MLLVDDLLFRPLIRLVDVLHSMAVREAYDVEGVQDDLKENRLLYELGERSEAEYQRRRESLRGDLELAEHMQEKLLRGNVEVVR